MLEWIVLGGFLVLVVAAVVLVGRWSWHLQGLGFLLLCLLGLWVTVEFGPDWFGIGDDEDEAAIIGHPVAAVVLADGNY